MANPPLDRIGADLPLWGCFAVFTIGAAAIVALALGAAWLFSAFGLPWTP